MLKTGLKTMLLTAVAMTAFAGAASAGKTHHRELAQ